MRMLGWLCNFSLKSLITYNNIWTSWWPEISVSVSLTPSLTEWEWHWGFRFEWDTQIKSYKLIFMGQFCVILKQNHRHVSCCLPMVYYSTAVQVLYPAPLPKFFFGGGGLDTHTQDFAQHSGIPQAPVVGPWEWITWCCATTPPILESEYIGCLCIDDSCDTNTRHNDNNGVFFSSFC